MRLRIFGLNARRFNNYDVNADVVVMVLARHCAMCHIMVRGCLSLFAPHWPKTMPADNAVAIAKAKVRLLNPRRIWSWSSPYMPRYIASPGSCGVTPAIATIRGGMWNLRPKIPPSNPTNTAVSVVATSDSSPLGMKKK